jgi:hypothetical protein
MKSNAYELFPFLVPQRPSTSVVRHPVQKSSPPHDPLPDRLIRVHVGGRRAVNVSLSLLSSKSLNVTVTEAVSQLMGRHGGGRG